MRVTFSAIEEGSHSLHLSEALKNKGVTCKASKHEGAMQRGTSTCEGVVFSGLA